MVYSMCGAQDRKEEETPANQQSKEAPRRWKLWREWRFWGGWSVGERFNFLLLIFTAIYAATSIFQYRLARQSLRVTERAYIEIHNVALEPAVASVGQITMVIQVTNTGRTPARSSR